MSDKVLETIRGYYVNPIGFPSDFFDVFTNLEVFKQINDLPDNATKEQKNTAYKTIPSEFYKITSLINEINTKEVARYSFVRKDKIQRPYTVEELGELINVIVYDLISCRSQIEFMKNYFMSVLPVIFTLLDDKVDKPQSAGA